MDYFERRKLFNQSFKSLIANTGLNPEKTNFNPYFLLREHSSVPEPVSTGKLDNSDVLSTLFLDQIKKIKAKAFLNKMRKLILRYSKLFNADFTFYSFDSLLPSLEIELNSNYKDLFDIDSVAFILRGEGVKTGYTTFRFFVHLKPIQATYEITRLDGRALEHQSFIDIHVNYKNVDDIKIPMLNAYKDIVSEIVGYEVIEVDNDIVTVLDMIKV